MISVQYLSPHRTRTHDMDTLTRSKHYFRPTCFWGVLEHIQTSLNVILKLGPRYNFDKTCTSPTLIMFALSALCFNSMGHQEC